MLLHKRIRKPTQPFGYQYNFSEKKAKNPNRKRKFKRCVYRLIPSNLKYAFSTKINCLYADIPIILLENERSIFCEFSLLNRYMRVEEIKVTRTFGEKLVNIRLDKKKEMKTLPWIQIVEKMEVSECPNLIEWAKSIRHFSEKYEQAISARNCLTLTSDKSKNPNYKILDENHSQHLAEFDNAQKLKLFESYPCIFLKSSLRGEGFGISEMIFNQSMINELGYNIETFTDTIFQEGIPQIMPFNDEANNKIWKLFLEKYFNNEKNGTFSSSPLHSSLILKDGTSRDIDLQVWFFTSHPIENKMGLDMMITFLDIKNGICQKKRKAPRPKINQNFVQKTKINQQEKDFFISSYYAEFIPLHYVYPDKVCKIKEIYVPPEEDYDEEVK